MAFANFQDEFSLEPDFSLFTSSFDAVASPEPFIQPIYDTVTVDKPTVQPDDFSTKYITPVSDALIVDEPTISRTNFSPKPTSFAISAAAVAAIVDDAFEDKRLVQPTDISRWTGTGNVQDIIFDKANVQPSDFSDNFANVGISAQATASIENDVIIDAPAEVLTGNSTTPVVLQTSTIDAPLQTAAFTPINNSGASTVVNDEVRPFFLSNSALIMAGLVAFVLLKNGVS